MHIYVRETLLSTRHSSQYLQEIFGLRLVEGKNRGAKSPHSQLIVLQSSATAMLQFIQYGWKMISEAFWLGHNPQLLYLRRLLFKDRVRVRASTRGTVRITFIVRVRVRVRVTDRVRDRVRVRVRVRDRVRVRVKDRVRVRVRVRVRFRIVVWDNVTCRFSARAKGR